MLSYQHSYHAGNLADVHKHVLLVGILEYMLGKDKPLTYIETHSGRGLYDLGCAEALKTRESLLGITAMLERGQIPTENLYLKVLQKIRALKGVNAYPGSPMIAALMLRPKDRIHLAEMHPQEFVALQSIMKKSGVQLYNKDGLKIASSLLPPTPRRGLMLVDPSYEIKKEYQDIADFIIQMNVKWPIGVIALWYPILAAGAYKPMVEVLLKAGLPEVFNHEIMFNDMNNPNHGLKGSGMFIINPPYGLREQADLIKGFFR